MESGESRSEQVGGMFRFQKLDIWKRSLRFANSVYDVTESFPRKEQFGLTSQLTRSAGSIGANIAEGSSRASNKDFSRFIEIAYGSLCETLSHLCLARMRKLVAEDPFRKLYREAEELARMLSSFRNSLGKWKSD